MAVIIKIIEEKINCIDSRALSLDEILRRYMMICNCRIAQNYYYGYHSSRTTVVTCNISSHTDHTLLYVLINKDTDGLHFHIINENTSMYTL